MLTIVTTPATHGAAREWAAGYACSIPGRLGPTADIYCTYGWAKIVDVGTLIFRWIIHFWYVCFIWRDKARLTSSPRMPEAQVSKVDYSSKTKSSNVRGVGTIFDTFLNLGHSFPYKYKNSCLSNTVWDFLISFLGSAWNFCNSVHIQMARR
jgi:hypothetical protein